MPNPDPSSAGALVLHPFLHHPDGTHRTTAPTSGGRDLDRFDSAIARHTADGHAHLPAAQLHAGDRIRFSTADGAVHDVTVAEVLPPLEVTIRDGRGRRFGFAGGQPVTILAATTHRRFPADQ